MAIKFHETHRLHILKFDLYLTDELFFFKYKRELNALVNAFFEEYLYSILRSQPKSKEIRIKISDAILQIGKLPSMFEKFKDLKYRFKFRTRAMFIIQPNKSY